VLYAGTTLAGDAMKVNLSELQRRFSEMPQELFSQVNAEELTEAARHCYDREAQRRSTSEWQALQAERQAKFERDRAAERQVILEIDNATRDLRWAAFLVWVLAIFVQLVVFKPISALALMEPVRAARAVGGILGSLTISFFLWVMLLPRLVAGIVVRRKRRSKKA
jgi:hypothetical protein